MAEIGEQGVRMAMGICGASDGQVDAIIDEGFDGMSDLLILEEKDITEMMSNFGCERFFSIAGYVLNPRRTSLKVRHYKALAMLKLNIQQMYIDKDWVVQHYLKMEKSKEWDATDTQSDELVAALELELYADDRGVPVEDLQLSEIESVGGDEGRVPSAAANVPINVPVGVLVVIVTTVSAVIQIRILMAM
jgi:hypothetical protein